MKVLFLYLLFCSSLLFGKDGKGGYRIDTSGDCWTRVNISQLYVDWQLLNNHEPTYRLINENLNCVDAWLMKRPKLTLASPGREREVLYTFDNPLFWEKLLTLEKEQRVLYAKLLENSSKMKDLLYEELVAKGLPAEKWSELWDKLQAVKTIGERKKLLFDAGYENGVMFHQREAP